MPVVKRYVHISALAIQCKGFEAQQLLDEELLHQIWFSHLPGVQGLHENVSFLQMFCPKCEDMYYPRSRFQRNLDGAYFGTTFPHLLLMTYPTLRPARPLEAYQPRVFGFKLHASALR